MEGVSDYVCKYNTLLPLPLHLLELSLMATPKSKEG